MKEIKILNKVEEDCKFDNDLGYYKVIREGMDDIIILKDFRYKEIRKVKITTINGELSSYEIVEVENCERHIVKPFETIKLIANTYGIRVDELVVKNNLKSEKLFVGQVLKV